MTVKHDFTSLKPDGSDQSLIRPSDWNAAHRILMEVHIPLVMLAVAYTI